MQYDDVATADPANAPLDGPLFFGAEPFFWLAVLAVILAVAVIAWLMGRNGSDRNGDATLSIWKAIDEAAKTAMTANGDDLPRDAAALKRTIEARLGRTLALAGGLGAGLKALTLALDSLPAEPAHDHGHGHGGHGQDGSDGHGDDHGGEETAARSGAAAAASGASANVTIIVPAGGGHGDHPTPPPRRLTAPERIRALRNAVADINEHWRHKADRLTELGDALAELSGH